MSSRYKFFIKKDCIDRKNKANIKQAKPFKNRKMKKGKRKT